MKLKLDENLGERGRDVLQQAGHDVATVRDQQLTSANWGFLACRVCRQLCIVLLLVILLFRPILAATDAGKIVFDFQRVAKIKISISDEDFQKMGVVAGTGYVRDYPYVPAIFEFDGLVLTNVGVKYEGHGLVSTPSLKVDFNRYTKGLHLDGLKKINIHNKGAWQPLLAEYLAYGAFREAGIPAPRTGWADVVFNGKNLGFCTTVEQVDQDFLDEHFEFSHGDLYKPEPPAGLLLWHGTNILSYTNIQHQLPDTSTHESLIHFLDVINNRPVAEIHQVLDLRGFISYLAGNAVLGNWDAFTEMAHNYLLYENAPGRFTFLPWDLTDALSSRTNLFPVGTGPWAGGKVTLTEKVLNDARFREAYLSMADEFLRGHASPVRLQQRVDLIAGIFTNHYLNSNPADALAINSNRVNLQFLQLALSQTNHLLPRIYINEVMASNRSIPDNYKEFDDWIEIYNAEYVPVDLGGAYLTDDLARVRKWMFPAGTVVPPRGYLLVWADEQPTQGPLHCNFKLDASGETLLLTDRDDNGNATLDRYAFPALSRDASAGRLPDGSARTIAPLLKPTPLGANDMTDSDQDGMPDAWEKENGLTVGFADGFLDLDGDGVLNRSEFLLGTDPRDSASPPRLVPKLVPATPSRVNLGWEARPAAGYVIEMSTNLTNGWEPIGVPRRTPGNVGAYTEFATNGPLNRFFRLRVFK